MNHKLFLIYFLFLCAAIAMPCRASDPPACGSIKKDVNTILASWKKKDWKHMYFLVSSKSKNGKNFTSFKKNREEMQKISKLVNYGVISTKKTGVLNAFVQVKLYMLYNPQTSYTFTDKWQKKAVNVKWNLVCEKGSWKIVLPQ